jgi:two-component system, NtrC family, sensor kinase
MHGGRLNHPRPTPMSPPPATRLWTFGLTMALALGIVLGVNLYMESGEAGAALEDFQREQAQLADAAAAVVQSHLEVQPDAPIHHILRDLKPLEGTRPIRIFLLPPGGAWQTSQGTLATQAAFPTSPTGPSLISRADAQAMGLPSRKAALGRASFLDSQGRSWSVAVAGSAYRERDRAQHAMWRLSLSFILTGGFLLLLIRWALRLQKKELELARDLEIQEMGRHKDHVLAQASRAATMLTLASGVAHEISTPLGVISGRAAQLSAGLKEDERASRQIHTIQEEVERINRTVRRFLDLARGGGLVSEDLEPEILVASAASMVMHRFELAGVALNVETSPDLPKLRGDSRLLEHLLVNVLLNACDASIPGSRVDLVARNEAGGLGLVVADQGKGIPDILVERVLEPFFTTKPKGKGTGLGLAIVKEIIRMHKGTLKFEKAQPHGTLVLIWLPVN